MVRISVAAALIVALGGSALLQAATISVAPGLASAVTRAVGRAKPGDVIELQGGIYQGTIEVVRSGQPDRPIVISPAPGASVTIDGGYDPAASPWFSGEDWGATSGTGRDNQGIRVADSNWIAIRGLRFVRCWTDVIVIERSSYISIQDCEIDHCGQYAVTTRDTSTHHVLVEGCTWIQDERIWTEWAWEELHHRSLWHYNGGLYGGTAASGAVIRRNRVSYVMNGFKWWPKVSQGKAQSNIEVYDNVFEYCRDNIIEPEGYALNFHVYHNELNSCFRGIVSVDGVSGGNIRLYGNTSYSSWDGCVDESWWTMFKFYSEAPGERFLDLPLYSYHNSWYSGQLFADPNRDEDHIRHLNNAIHLFRGSIGWPVLCGTDKLFDYDCSSQLWPAAALEQGFEAHGIVAAPMFADRFAGDFRLLPGSPCVDAGTVIKEFTQWYLGDAPDIGAYEGSQRVYGRPFRYEAPPGGAGDYVERPRIVRCFAYRDQIAVFFSTDLSRGPTIPQEVQIALGGEPVHISSVDYPSLRRVMTLTVAGALPGGDSLDLVFTRMPEGENGLAATMWAADLHLARIPDDAVLVDEVRMAFTSSAPAQVSQETTTYVTALRVADCRATEGRGDTTQDTSTRRIAVLFDESHNERNTVSGDRARALDSARPDTRLFGALAEGLEKAEIFLARGTAELSDASLAGCDVVLFSAPEVPCSGDERLALMRFVCAGGGLIVLTDGALEKWASGMFFDWLGFLVLNVVVCDAETTSTKKWNFWVEDFNSEHPLFNGVDRIWANSSGVLVLGDEWDALAWSPGSSWLDDGDNAREPEERLGPFVYAAARDWGSGRVLVLADNAFVDAHLGQSPGNLRLLANAIAWLAGVGD
jgi:hypothetical protein